MKKGIYKIKIKDKTYIGQDSKIGVNKRFNEHINMLRNNTHFNNELQKDFNLYGESNVTYEVLEESKLFSSNDLDNLEIKYIKELDTFNSSKGYNKTKGGIGMLGFKQSEDTLQKKSIALSGEKNPQSKLSNAQFFEIVEMLKSGYTNSEIAKKYGLHSRYVSLIRHKKRYQNLWSQVFDYTPKTIKSGHRKISYTDFLEIKSMLDSNSTNAEIERKFGLSSGTGSRIRHKKYYKDYWNKLEERSTTIENTSN